MRIGTRTLHLSGFAAMILLAATGSAFATLYEWTLSGGGDSGSGTLQTGSADGNGYDIIGFTGLIDGQSVALTGGQPGPNGASTPGGGLGVYYDNILYPGLNSGTPNCAGGTTLVDGCGIAFTIDGDYANIFDNYSGSGTGAYIYTVESTPTVYNNQDATFSITPAPEPASVALLGFSVAALILARHRVGHKPVRR